MSVKGADMDIQEFVRESLVQVAMGIVEANKVLKEKTNADHHYFKMEASVRSDGRKGVEFDIAIVARQEAGGGIKLNIPFIALGGDASGKTASENVSRMKFNVAAEYDFA
jgi:hypothetical protein